MVALLEHARCESALPQLLRVVSSLPELRRLEPVRLEFADVGAADGVDESGIESGCEQVLQPVADGIERLDREATLELRRRETASAQLPHREAGCFEGVNCVLAADDLLDQARVKSCAGSHDEHAVSKGVQIEGSRESNGG